MRATKATKLISFFATQKKCPNLDKSWEDDEVMVDEIPRLIYPMCNVCGDHSIVLDVYFYYLEYQYLPLVESNFSLEAKKWKKMFGQV